MQLVFVPAADLAGTARIKYSPNVRIIRVMCSGRVDPTFVMKAFSLGADGVMLAGCHPGECHYIEQNYKAMRRFSMIQHTLGALGLEPERFRLVWASAAEGQLLAEQVNKFVEDVRELGPLDWPARTGPRSPEREHALAEIVKEHAEALEVQS